MYNFGWEASPATHQSVIEILLKLMRDTTLGRHTKPLILEAMTCMLTTLGAQFLQWISHVFRILIGAMAVPKPVGVHTEEAEDTITFVDQLRAEILLFNSELLMIPEAAQALSNQQYQKALGSFCMVLAGPGQATDEHRTLLSDMLVDLAKTPATRQLAQALARQPAMRPFFPNP